MLPDDDPDFRFPFPFVVVVVTPEEPEEVEFGFLLFVDMVSVLSIVAVFISEPEAVAAAATSTVVLEGSLGEELFDAITDDAEVGLEIEILIGTAVDWVPPEFVDDFEFAPESGVLKRSSAVLLEVVPPGTLPLSLSVVTRNTVSLS